MTDIRSGTHAGSNWLRLASLERSSGLRAMAMAVVVWIAIASVLIGIARHEWDNMLAGVQSTAVTVSQLLADHSDRLLESADLVRYQAELVAGTDGPIGATLADHKSLQRLIGISPNIVSIWLGDAQGMAVLTTREFPAPQLSAADREYFTAVRDDPDSLFVGNLLDSRHVAEELLINTSRRFSAPDGAFRGFVQVSLDPAAIRETFQRVEIGFNASLWWIGPDGRPLIREPALPAERLEDQAPPGLESWPQTFEEPIKGQVDGQNRLFFWSDSSLYGNRIIVGVGYDQMVARWRANVAPIAMLGGILALSASVIIWLMHRAQIRRMAYAARLERDISERTRDLDRAVEQKDLILQELGHRVRNAFTTIVALTRQMLRTTDTLEGFRQEFPARLEALAKSQVLLVEAEDRGRAQISDLAAAALAPYQIEDMKITISGPPTELRSEHTVGVGLILHELVTNAVKYGGLSVPGGAVSVHWEACAKGIRLNWKETGGPVVVEPTRYGSGTEIMNRAALLIDGTLVRHLEPDGMRVELTIPIEQRH